MNLMDKYHELSTMSEYPPDYAEQWAGLAAMFLADGRPLMSDACRRRSAYYSDSTVLCGIGGKKVKVAGRDKINNIPVILYELYQACIVNLTAEELDKIATEINAVAVVLGEPEYSDIDE
jgi:hypothetical protein